MVFYKDLNERFISENPSNTVSSLLSPKEMWLFLPQAGWKLSSGQRSCPIQQAQQTAWMMCQVLPFAALLSGAAFPAVQSQALHWGRLPMVRVALSSCQSRVNRQQRKGSPRLVVLSKPWVPPLSTDSPHTVTVPWTGTWCPQEPITLCSLVFQLVILLSNFGGQLGLWMSCSVVCVIEIIEVFFIDSLSIVMRRQWQKAKKWWNNRQRERPGKASQAGDLERQGHDNPVCIDEDLPTFNTALRLPLPQERPLPRTPPPNYSTLRLETAFTEQLPDTLELGQR